MKLLALDQATAISGWAIFSGNTLEAYGTIEAHHENLGARLLYIQNEIRKLIRQYNITHIAFENIQYQNNNVVTFKSLAEVYGTIELLCWELNIPYVIIPSVSWKSTFGIKGKNRPEQKKNAQEWVPNTYGITTKQDSIDAIVIGSHVLAHKDIEWVNTSNSKEKFKQEYEEKGAF